MTRFNKPQQNTTENHEGSTAFMHSPELQLYSLVVTCMVSDKFYESSDDQLVRLRGLLPTVDPKFAVQLAIYAREEMHLRTIPLVLMIELARIHSGDNLVSQGVGRVIQRVDEITEMLAYYCAANNRNDVAPLSKQIQKGLQVAFNKFNHYQFAMYNRPGKVTLKDALFIVRPSSDTFKQSEVFAMIASGTLGSADTWETSLSSGLDKKEAWEELIMNDKLGYMAMMRNLRNFVQAGISKDALVKVCQFISAKERVLASKQLPFRFYSAYRMLKEVEGDGVTMILDSLNKAVKHSIANIPFFSETESVMIACDVSASMMVPLSDKSVVEYYDVGLLLGSLLQANSNFVQTGLFGDTFKVYPMASTNILENACQLRRCEGDVGYATNGHTVIEYLTQTGKSVDKVVMFTDCQMTDSSYDGRALSAAWNQYKTQHPNSKLYIFNLSGYGKEVFSQHANDIFQVAGWSEKIFDMLHSLESGDSVISTIQKISI